MSDFNSLKKYFIDIEEVFSMEYFVSSKAVNLFNTIGRMIAGDNPFHDIGLEFKYIRNFIIDHPSYQEYKISSIRSNIFQYIKSLSSYLTDESISSVKSEIENIACGHNTPETKSYKLLNFLYDVVEDISYEITNKTEDTKELEDKITDKIIDNTEDTKEDRKESEASNKNKNKSKKKKGRNNMKKGMNKLMKKMMEKSMPSQITDGSVALSMAGKIVIKRNNGDYVRYDKTKDEIINEMEFVLDDKSISKMLFLLPVNSIKNNDIIKVNDTYYHIINAEKLEAIDLESGTREILISEEDMLFKNNMFKKVISIFSTQDEGINPFILYAMNKFENSNSKDSDELLKLITMSNIMSAATKDNNVFGNQTTNFQNSMMLMAMSSDDEMIKKMLMIQMMNSNMADLNNTSDQNPSGNNMNQDMLNFSMMSALLSDEESENEECDIEVSDEDDFE